MAVNACEIMVPEGEQIDRKVFTFAHSSYVGGNINDWS